jgi:hypothetical protein
MRRLFFAELFRMLRMAWPILSGIVLAMVGPGLLVGNMEGWSVVDSFYFTFVTGLTIGYGDLVPRLVLSRLLVIVIGFAGIMLSGLVVAMCVQALLVTAREHRQ